MAHLETVERDLGVAPPAQEGTHTCEIGDRARHVGRWPRVAVPLLAGFAVVEYFLGDLAPLFKAPGWVANLSIFHLYGNPVAAGASWTAVLSMTAVFLAGFAAALALMRRRDVSTA